MSFERTEFDYCISNNGYISRFFSQYYFKSNTETDYYIISNKGTEGNLIPELKETDYFMLIKNYFDDEEIDNILTNLKQINDIVVAISVNPKQIKSKENLIF